MKLYQWVAALIAGSVCFSSPIAFAQRHDDTASIETEINLAVGETKTISATGVRNYTEGTSGIVSIKLTPDNRSFILGGLKSGTTTLLLIRDNGSEQTIFITVNPRSPEAVEAELKQLLQGFTGVSTRRVGSRLFIDGSVATESDVKRIAKIAALYNGQVESLVAIGGGKDKTNIRVDFFFIEYDKTSGYQVGISYPQTIGGPYLTGASTYDLVGNAWTAVASLANQPLPGLDIASNHGWAKVSKQATVITTNGSDASFAAGGEQNFITQSAMASSIVKIQYGTNITVQPWFDPVTREMELKVSADVSDLVPPVSGTTLPGRETSSLSTIVHMRLGQSLVISGFTTRQQRHSVAGLPILSEIPVFGIFFGTHGDTKEDREGAVLIVPNVVEAIDSTRGSLVDEALKQYEEWGGGDMPHTAAHLPASPPPPAPPPPPPSAPPPK